MSPSPSQSPEEHIAAAPLQLWGGFESTVNRVDEAYFDQMVLSGHEVRSSDLEQLANLGIKTVRYPVLWERVAPQGLDSADWSWTDERLGILRSLGIQPVVGLLHHGSGPRDTSLVDPDFPEKFAAYARAVAERYPWVSRYTPINEPLTTARFSCLYGFWYPHHANDLSFARAAVNQCRATVLAMRAIRQVNPDAQLIGTEDLGKTYSTSRLQYQADFENERRWLSYDLLCGSLDRDSVVARWLVRSGVSEQELEWFAANACPPDILGFNYYLTSERFLDHRTNLYPRMAAGGNERDPYVDVEAVRVTWLGGWRNLLRDAWERFRRPMAITEVHNGCTREEQMRWLVEAWQTVQDLRTAAIDVRAITVWALLGSHDWNSLVTRRAGHYEPGAFDTRSPSPRPTALARATKSLTATGHFDHPLLDSPGWWHRPERFHFGHSVHTQLANREECAPSEMPKIKTRSRRPLLITGATGTLGRAFARICDIRGIDYRLLRRSELDIANPLSVQNYVKRHSPWAIINTAGFVRVDEAESCGEQCRRENSDGPAILARSCAENAVKLLTFSSDLVFDGTKQSPYVESDAVAPLSEYGRSKAEAEQLVLTLDPSALVVRTSAFFGPWDSFNYLVNVLRNVADGVPFSAADDITVSPTYVPDLVNTALELLIDDESGIWHLVNTGSTTWFEFARTVASTAGYDASLVRPATASSFGWPAARPAYSALASEKASLMPSLESAISRFLSESQPCWLEGGILRAA